MNVTLSIAELGDRLKRVDTLLMTLLKRRMDLALEVGRRKKEEGKTDSRKRRIFNPRREADRLKGVHDWARKHGMNPHFARTVLYTIIGESCKEQMIQMQREGQEKDSAQQTEQQWRKILRRNLLTLTKKWSETYDVDYDRVHFATRSYREFELEIIKEEIKGLSERRKFLDLGCATGKLAFDMAKHFDEIVGYDISPHMVAKANSKIPMSRKADISFKVTDLEDGIPEPDRSVSMIGMNLGTAGDIRNISKLMKEINRVLKSHGRFLLSFYNREALLYNWDFIPWPIGLGATVNTYKDCIDVDAGAKTLSVYGKAYLVDEAVELVKGGITTSKVVTYPTISSLLPTDLFENQKSVQESVAAADRQLADQHGGAYIIVTGQKTH